MVNGQNRDTNSQGTVRLQEQQKRTNDMVYMDKRHLFTFTACVINSTANVKSKNGSQCSGESPRIIKTDVEEVRENLAIQSSQDVPWVGSS